MSNLELFDTHCHIQSAGHDKGERATRDLWAKAEDTNIDDIIARAQESGVNQLLCVGCDLEDSRLAIECAQNWPTLYASIGIHPHEAAKYIGKKGLLDAFADLLTAPKVVAVGETGLDYFYNHSPREAQIEVLRFQMELALQDDLPMIFHVREAFEDFWPIFESYQSTGQRIRGVLHSFTDSVENMQRAVGHGLYIGVNGIATFAKGEAQNVMYRTIPPESLLLETDSPFLTPVPYRGTINEPKHIRTIVEFLTEVRSESIEALAMTTTHNARALFRV